MHWTPPQAALEAVAAAATDPALSQYGPDAGMPLLRHWTDATEAIVEQVLRTRT